MRATMLVLGPLLTLLASSTAWGQSPAKAEKDFFEANIRPILVAHCYSCHSKDTEKPKGNFRLDQLSLDFANGEHREAWLEVMKRVKAGEMPPKGKARPPEKAI